MEHQSLARGAGGDPREMPPLRLDDAAIAERARLMDAPETHARRILQDLPLGRRVQAPPGKPESEMTNYERGWVMAYGVQAHVDSQRPKYLAEWIVKGLILAGVVLTPLIVLYVVLGPQQWMSIGGFLWAIVMRSWWRAKP